MRVGHGSGLGAARVNHDEFAAARLHGFGLAAKVGHGPHAAVAGQRVGANDDEQIAARNVGHRDGQPGAKHQAAGELLGDLVHAGRRKNGLGAQAARQLGEVGEQADFVGRRVAGDQAYGVAPVGGDQRRQAAFNFCKGLIPAHGHVHAIALDHGAAQAVRVFVQVFERHRLGADVAGAKHVGLVAANADDFLVLDLDLQAAAGLAQRANSVVGGGGHRWKKVKNRGAKRRVAAKAASVSGGSLQAVAGDQRVALAWVDVEALEVVAHGVQEALVHHIAP